MAKSARSRSKCRNRNVLRANVFGPIEQARIERLAEKQRVKNEQVDEVTMDAQSSEAVEKTAEKAAVDSDSEMVDGSEEGLKKRSKRGKVAKMAMKKKRNKSATRTISVRGKGGQVTKKKVLNWRRSTGFN
ncbi:hypothetical protein H4R99_007485 [Coemansia sp. RSA 1722]|nr:hypothetical protein IWW45_001763 [Coemansia sp. RSA 485]KAJ2589372.1 hypothetical protein H4R99_007485 [Coemansia sp. RSA 1722]